MIAAPESPTAARAGVPADVAHGCARGCAGLTALPLIVFAQAIGALLDGWVASKVWAWLVASYAARWGIPAPAIGVWIGLGLTVALLFRSRVVPKVAEKVIEIIADLVTRLYVAPLNVLAVAYLIYRMGLA